MSDKDSNTSGSVTAQRRGVLSKTRRYSLVRRFDKREHQIQISYREPDRKRAWNRADVFFRGCVVVEIDQVKSQVKKFGVVGASVLIARVLL